MRDGRLEVDLPGELEGGDLFFQPSLVLLVAGPQHGEPHVDGLERELNGFQQGREILRVALVAQVQQLHRRGVGHAHRLRIVRAEIDRRGQHLHLLSRHPQPGHEVARELVGDDHHVGVHQTKKFLPAHARDEAPIGFGFAHQEGEIDRRQRAGVVDELVPKLRAPFAQGVAPERVEEVHHHVFFAVELAAHRAIERLHPGGEIARAHRYPQQPGALIALDVGVIGRLHREHDHLVPLGKPLEVLRHSTGDRRGRRHHVEAAQQQSRQVAHRLGPYVGTLAANPVSEK